MDIHITSGQGIDLSAVAAVLSVAVAALALILPWRTQVERRARSRLGARNVYFFAWRMIDSILDNHLSGTIRPRDRTEFEAVEIGLDAIRLDALDPAGLIQHAIELRYAWNVAKGLAFNTPVNAPCFATVRLRASNAMAGFDRQVFADGARFDSDDIAHSYRWNRALVSFWRWCLNDDSPPRRTGAGLGAEPEGSTLMVGKGA